MAAVDPDELTAEWAAFADEWIARSEEHRDAPREGVLDDWMLDLVGDVTGLHVIDLGCGEGRFCRMLAECGAETLGIDLQPAFVDHANARRCERETYRIGDIQELVDVPDGTYDLAISYITLVDVPDQRAAIGEAFRVLRPGGRFVVCNISPMASAWTTFGTRCTNGDHYILDDYTDEGARRAVWRSGHEITNFHRMLSTTVNDFLDAGFVLRGLHEPVPTAEQVARQPEIADLLRVPFFTIYDLVKPA